VKRHVFDPLSFVFGIAFVALAGALSTGNIRGLQLDIGGLRWAGAAILLIVGIVMLLGSRAGSRENES
jgi:small neutral amino acid transporter SnatA (MarC family)